MIAADEASKLAGNKTRYDIEEYVDSELEKVSIIIETAAKDNKRRITLNDELWYCGGYHNSDEFKLAKKKLEDLGFKVTYIYEDGQFANMFTKVEW